VAAGLSFLGAPPPERRTIVRGCEEGDGRLLRRVAQATEVMDLASVGDGGHCGGLKGQRTGGVRWRAERPPDGVSAAQAVLPSGVVAGSGRGWPVRWAGGLGDRRCSCSEPLLRAPSSHGGGLFRAVSGVLVGVGGRSTVGWSFAGRSGSAFGGGRHVAPVRHRRLFTWV
jgi:hypothetical protein